MSTRKLVLKREVMVSGQGGANITLPPHPHPRPSPCSLLLCPFYPQGLPPFMTIQTSFLPSP